MHCFLHTDYYPFGMLMPNRHGSDGESHRYGFQNQEKDDEIYGSEGTFINYKYRGADTRIGRFFAVDPLTHSFPWNSSYAFSENRVIDGLELEGLEVKIYTESPKYSKGNVGHTFLSVGSAENLIVYTYGRYDNVDKNKGSANSTNISGEGVLIRLTGAKAEQFVKKYKEKYNAKTFVISDINKQGEEKVKQFFEDKFNASNEMPDRPGGKYENNPDARVIDEYNLIDNNCTTITRKGVDAGGSKVFKKKEIIAFGVPGGGGYAPAVKMAPNPSTPNSMEKFLETKSKKKYSGVKATAIKARKSAKYRDSKPKSKSGKTAGASGGRDY